MSICRIARKKTFTAAFLALFECFFGFSQSAMVVTGVGYVGPVTVDTRGMSAGTLQLSVSSTSVYEDAGSVTLTVTRSGGSSGAASVNYATANGTAGAGTDYVVTSGTLTWADGDVDSKTITIPILNRSDTQGSRKFTMTFSGASGASMGSTSNVQTRAKN